MTFTYPSLALLGAALAVVPIVIHLLNLRRRRRVRWAAMDFLLQSDRKNRTWVRLNEWLLLMARVAAIALAGLFAATPRTAGLLDGLLGDEPALHLVLMDDTASMQHRHAGSTAWEEATAAVERLVESAEGRGDRILIARYTDQLAGREPLSHADGPGGPTTWGATNATATAAAGLGRLLEEHESAEPSTAYAYLLSDFGETLHGEAADWAEPLRALAGATDGLVLAACGDPAADNLSVESLRLAPGPAAAGVETRLAIGVANHSEDVASPTTLALRRDGQPLTAIEIGPFEPGERRHVEVPITLAGVGLHVVEAELPSDRLPADDHRWLAVETPAAQSVVLIDNSTRAIESRVLAAALRPIGKARSGWSPVRVAEPTADDLAGAAAVVVVDAERLGPVALASLRDYVGAGGGVLWIAGPRTDADWFNRRVAGGLAGEGGLVPWRLGPPTSVPPVEAGEAMLRVEDHPALRVLGGERNAFLPLVRAFVRRRLATDEEAPVVQTTATSDSAAEYKTLIAMRDSQPLSLESRYGAGRVLGLLTTAATGRDQAPPWSNLATLPIFPVLVNDLVGWLAQDRLAPLTEPIGVQRAEESNGVLQRWSPGGGFEVATGFGPAERLAPAEPGVYRRAVGRRTEPTLAAVIDPRESDLRGPSLEALRNRWGDLARVGRAEAMFRDTPEPESRLPMYAVAATLLGVCLVERTLAYRSSYLQSGATAR